MDGWTENGQIRGTHRGKVLVETFVYEAPHTPSVDGRRGALLNDVPLTVTHLRGAVPGSGKPNTAQSEAALGSEAARCAQGSCGGWILLFG